MNVIDGAISVVLIAIAIVAFVTVLGLYWTALGERDTSMPNDMTMFCWCGCGAPDPSGEPSTSPFPRDGWS